MGNVTTPATHCLHRLFEQQAALTPDAPAVSDGRETLGYQELDERAARLATVIRRFGPAPGQLIGLYVRRGNDLVISILAVLKAGCAYVPLDPDYPKDRIRYMARDASLDLVITDQDVAGVLPETQLIPVDEPLWPGEEHAEPLPDVTPDLPAYVIYTSGSSGTPKGVVVTHANVTALLAGCDQIFDLRADDIWALFHSYCFDFSVWEMWGALTHGARLVVVPGDMARSPEAMLTFLEEHQVTVLNQVPSVFRYLSRAATAATATSEDLPLRYVIFGGEPVDVEAVRAWRRRYGLLTEFVNMYGITETTVFATYRWLVGEEIDRAASAATGELPDPALGIGVPLPGTDVVVLDENHRRVAAGQVGELYQSGPQLAQGYLNRPELTADRYPLLDVDGDGTPRRYYRSGDLVSIRADGTLEYAGRADDQVKINGYRIETAEVEHALRGTEGVQDLVVMAVTSRAGEPMLAAFYTPAPGAPTDGMTERLNANGDAVLPAYMLPRRYVQLPSIPLTPSGKTDKRALARHA
jgi:amino acid adenylation domain-containing protein